MLGQFFSSESVLQMQDEFRISDIPFPLHSAFLKLSLDSQLTFIYMIRRIYGVSDMRKHASVCEYELIHIISLEGPANGT